MDPTLKAQLDVARATNKDGRQHTALRKLLSDVRNDKAALLDSIRYLSRDRYSNSDTVNTILVALEEVNAIQELVHSLRAEEFIVLLHFREFRDNILPQLRDEEKLQRLVADCDDLSELYSDEVVTAIVKMTVNAERFLDPGRISSGHIDDLLRLLAVPSQEFFPSLANEVTDRCLMHFPQDSAMRWLDTFLRELISYYGDDASSWISEQVQIRHSESRVWERALDALMKKKNDLEMPIELTSEQRKWMRRRRLERVRRDFRNQYDSLLYHAHDIDRKHGSPQIIIQGPLVLSGFSSEFPGHEHRPIWSWLMSEAVETAFYSWIHEACTSLSDDYGNPEDSITGALCAYMKNGTSSFRELLETAWTIQHPNELLKLEVDYVNCRKRRDVGGADLVFVLSAKAHGVYIRSSFAAFQCKKMKQTLAFSDREVVQKDQLRSFSRSSYYMLYPCESGMDDSNSPIIVPANTVHGLLRARTNRSIDRQMLTNVGRSLEEYFLTHLLPGWSGDDRWENPETIQEVVEAGLQPVRIMHVVINVVPRAQSREQMNFDGPH